MIQPLTLLHDFRSKCSITVLVSTTKQNYQHYQVCHREEKHLGDHFRLRSEILSVASFRIRLRPGEGRAVQTLHVCTWPAGSAGSEDPARCASSREGAHPGVTSAFRKHHPKCLLLGKLGRGSQHRFPHPPAPPVPPEPGVMSPSDQ